MAITTDEDVLGGEPRIEGTRIGVRHVANRVVDSGQPPAYVADQLDLTLAAVSEAMSYYDDHIEQVRKIEQENETGREHSSEDTVKPKEKVQ
jgi:uncharacterized protein (DUF433 family)